MTTMESHNFITKFKFLMPRFWTTLVLTSLFYVVLCDFLIPFVFKAELSKFITQFILPGSIGLLSYLLFVRPKLIYFVEDRGRWRIRDTMFSFIWVTISISAYSTHQLYNYTFNTIYKAKDLNEVEAHKNEQFFTIKNIYFQYSKGSILTNYTTSGKHDQTLNIDIYFVYPFVNDSIIYDTTHYKTWYVLKYRKSVNNNKSKIEEDTIQARFLKECIDSVTKLDFWKYEYLENGKNEDDYDLYTEAVENVIGKNSKVPPLILIPRYENIHKEFVVARNLLILSFGIGNILLSIVLIFAHKKKNFDQDDTLSEIFKILIPEKNNYVTMSLIYINCIVFCWIIYNSGYQIMEIDGLKLLNMGALRRTEVLKGEWYRLITCVFMHGGIMHLIMNMVALFFVIYVSLQYSINNLENIYKKWGYLFCFIISGIGGSLSSIYWNVNIISVGASGAILGLYGIRFVLVFHKDISNKIKKEILISTSLMLIATGAYGFTNNVDNAAHIGGFITGCLIGYFMLLINKPQIFPRNKKNYILFLPDKNKIETKLFPQISKKKSFTKFNYPHKL